MISSRRFLYSVNLHSQYIPENDTDKQIDRQTDRQTELYVDSVLKLSSVEAMKTIEGKWRKERERERGQLVLFLA